MMIFRLVPAKGLQAVWRMSLLQDGLARIQKKGSCGWIAPDIYAAIRYGKASLYFAFADDKASEPIGFIVLEQIEEPHSFRVYLNCWLAYAQGQDDTNFADALQFGDDAVAQLDSIAKALGLDTIRIHGREGWQRVLKDKFEVKHTVYERRLS